MQDNASATSVPALLLRHMVSLSGGYTYLTNLEPGPPCYGIKQGLQ